MFAFYAASDDESPRADARIVDAGKACTERAAAVSYGGKSADAGRAGRHGGVRGPATWT